LTGKAIGLIILVANIGNNTIQETQ
jgi:hypothetical protein